MLIGDDVYVQRGDEGNCSSKALMTNTTATTGCLGFTFSVYDIIALE